MSEIALKLIQRAKAEGWKRLNLGNCGIVGAVPEEVGDLERLEELNLSNDFPRFYLEPWKTSNIAGPTNEISSFPSKLPPQLIVLIADNTLIQDIKPVDRLIQLRELSLANTLISNIQPLATLYELQRLHLDDTQIKSIDFLKGMQKMQHLNLNNTEIDDIGALSQMNALLTLQLGATLVTDIRPLAALLQLQDLDLSETKVSDILPLAGLTNLVELCLSFTGVSDITPLKSLHNLQRLWLNNNEISDITSVKGLVRLQKLALDNTNVADVSSIAELIELDYLDLSRSQVRDISPIKSLIEKGTAVKTMKVYNTKEYGFVTGSVVFIGTSTEPKPSKSNDYASYSEITRVIGESYEGLEPPKVENLVKIENPILISGTYYTQGGKTKLLNQFDQAYRLQMTGINLVGCPITTPPIEILEKGNQAILDYFIQREK